VFVSVLPGVFLMEKHKSELQQKECALRQGAQNGALRNESNQVKILNPHNSKSSQRMQARTVCVRAGRCGAACFSGFPASGWADIHIIHLSFLSLVVAADALLSNG
jgi:hypothetical protein